MSEANTDMDQLTGVAGTMADFFPSVSHLIPEFTLGDELTWNRLTDEFRAGLLAKARLLLRNNKLKSQFGPDDLIQETPMKAWNRHETFKGTTAAQFASWLLIIMSNTFRDWFRCSRDDASISTWFDFSDGGETRSSIAISREREAALHACLVEMSPKYRQVIIWHYFDGLRFSEIARVHGMNANTVASNWRRAASQLNDLME